MKTLYIYKTNNGNTYIESDDTYKHTKGKQELYQIETDYPEPIKPIKLQQEIKTSNDIDNLLQEIFGEA